MNNYLIPANSKQGLLIFGIFKWIDLVIFLVGLTGSFILLMALPPSKIWQTAVDLSPVLLAAALVTPIPNYHNTLTVLIALFDFLRIEQKLEWKGWEHAKVYGNEEKKI